MGPPGSGKGTLAQKCRDDLGYIRLSTGDLCRKHIAEQTPIGMQIDHIISEGRLIPDELIFQMVKDWLNENPGQSSIILDGFPRTVRQAEALIDFLTNSVNCYNLYCVRITASDDTIIRRIIGRLTCSNSDCQAIYSAIEGSPFAPSKSMTCDKCGSPLVIRADDDAESIKERLKVYFSHEQKLLDFLKAKKIRLFELDGEQSAEKVFSAFRNLFKE